MNGVSTTCNVNDDEMLVAGSAVKENKPSQFTITMKSYMEYTIKQSKGMGTFYYKNHTDGKKTEWIMAWMNMVLF